MPTTVCYYCVGTDLRADSIIDRSEQNKLIEKIECENCGKSFLVEYRIFKFHPLPSEEKYSD